MKKLIIPVLAITLAAIPILIHPSITAYASSAAPSSQNAPASQDKPAAPPAAQDKPMPDKPTTTDTRINGKWHFVFDTQGGDRDFNAEFTVDPDGKITGTWDKSPVAGTYKDGHLQLAFETHSDEAGETAQLQIDGKMDDTSTITGNWVFSAYDGPFKATRPKP